MDLQTAIDNYGRAMQHCDNIIQVHKDSGGGGVGRRIQQVSLDRAVIVVAVAAWQAAVQDMIKAILDECAPVGGAPADLARYKVHVGPVRSAVGAFATPNGQNTRNLMISAGFDPYPLWTYTIAGGGAPPQTWQPRMVQDRIDEWLRVRHAVAHGHDQMPVVQALQAVRLYNSTTPNVRLVDAEQCVAFFDRLVRLMSHGLAAHLGVTIAVAR